MASFWYLPPTNSKYQILFWKCWFLCSKILEVFLAGNFNAEKKEVILSNNFVQLYNLRNLVKENTCLKSVENPLSVDLFLTNCCRAFQNTSAISSGISGVHKMIITISKTKFKKPKPTEIFYSWPLGILISIFSPKISKIAL